jgi:hypothetical protein
MKAGLRVTGVFTSPGKLTRLVRQVDSEGRVRFSGAPADAQEFKLTAFGYLDTESVTTALTEGKVTDGGDIQLTPQD